MEEDDFISKTRRKREMREVQDLGAALVLLTPEQLARFDLPETLREAIAACRDITKHEARRRQMQWIGKLMRHVDPAPIAQQLAGLNAPSRQQTALFHVAEKWRDELVAEPLAIERFAREFPHADNHKLRALAEAARAERAAKRAPKHFRELFHAVNAVIQEYARPT